MTGTRKVSVRIDAGLKDEFERVLDGIGLDPTNAMRCFAFQVARKGELPFAPSSIEFEMSGKTVVTSFKVAEEAANDAEDVLHGLGMNFSNSAASIAVPWFITHLRLPPCRLQGR